MLTQDYREMKTCCFAKEIAKLLGGAYCVGNSCAGEPPYFLRRAILLRISRATIIRVAKHPFHFTRPPHHSLAPQMAANNELSWPVIAAELNNTGRGSDKFPHPSLDVYK